MIDIEEIFYMFIMELGNKNTTNLTFRVDKKIGDELRTNAEHKKLSLNMLGNQIFSEYVEFQQYANQFGKIVLTKDSFKVMLDSLEEEEVIKVAKKIAKNSKEFIIFRWGEINHEIIIKFLQICLDYGGFGQYTINKSNDNTTLSIKHELGKKGSLFIKTFFEFVIRSTMDTQFESEISNDTILIVIHTRSNIFQPNSISENGIGEEDFTKKSISNMRDGEHLAIVFKRETDLEKIVVNFIKRGIKNNQLNVIAIFREDESKYKKFLSKNRINLKTLEEYNQIYFVFFDDLFKGKDLGSTFDPILDALYIASEIVKKTGKSGLNIIGTLAGTLHSLENYEDCYNIEKHWHKLLPNFRIPMTLLCPYHDPVSTSSTTTLRECHNLGIKHCQNLVSC